MTDQTDAVQDRNAMTLSPERAGPLLRTGCLRDFNALGSSGTSLFTTALQMRSTVRRQIGESVSSYLSVPQISAEGLSVNWYAPSGSRVVPWTAATAAEQQSALSALNVAREQVAAHIVVLEARTGLSKDLELYARLLPFVLFIPDETHIYLVDGKPVVTFWGFSLLKTDVVRDVIGSLVPVASVSSPPAQPAKAGWPWWLWLLLSVPLFLLFLLLLVWFLRWWTAALPGAGILSLPAWISGSSIEERRESVPILPDRENTIIVPRITVDDPNGDQVASDSKRVNDGKGTASHGQDQTFADEPAPKDLTSDVASTEASGVETLSPDKEMPPALPITENQPLNIPAETDGGPVDFLDGAWRSHTGLVDGATGLPLEVEYVFDKGAGTATVRRSDGVSCTGPGQARMDAGRLVIDQTGPARCPDGREFAPSQITCSRDDAGITRCQGVNPDGGVYHVDMGRLPSG